MVTFLLGNQEYISRRADVDALREASSCEGLAVETILKMGINV